MRQQQGSRLRFPGDSGRLGKKHVVVLQRLLSFILRSVHALEDQQVRPGRVLSQRFAGARVRTENHFDSLPFAALHVLRTHGAPARFHAFPLLQALPFAQRHAERFRFFRIENRRPFQFQAVPEAGDSAVVRRERADLQADQFRLPALRRKLMQQHGIGQRRNDDAEALHDAFQPFRTPDVESFLPPRLFEAQQQAGEARAVIAVVMGQQQPVQAAESPPQAPDSDLRAFSAVDQERLPIHAHIEGRQRPVRDRQRSAGSQRAALQHLSSLLCFPSAFPPGKALRVRPRDRGRSAGCTAPGISGQNSPRTRPWPCRAARCCPSSTAVRNRWSGRC